MTVEGITRIFRHVLESDDVAADSDFFELGGDSLLATRVLAAIARESGTELTFEDFALAPSASALSDRLAGAAR